MPQNKTKLREFWIHRQRLFRIASTRLQFPNTSAELEKIISENLTEKNITGNRILWNEAVMEPINIWNSANYLSCNREPFDTRNKSEEEKEDVFENEDLLNNPYEIMETRKLESEREIDAIIASSEELEAKDYNEEEEIDVSNY